MWTGALDFPPIIDTVPPRGVKMKKMKIVLMVAATLQMVSGAMAAEIGVMSGGAPKEALAILIPQFEKLTGHHVKMTYAVISALQQRLAAGETPDIDLLPMPAVAALARSGQL